MEYRICTKNGFPGSTAGSVADSVLQPVISIAANIKKQVRFFIIQNVE
jgi:hypothetical protein